MIVGVSVPLATAIGQGAATGIDGAVTGTDGTPISGASVAYQRVPALVSNGRGGAALAPGEQLNSGTVKVDGNGRFSINMLAGQYYLCATVDHPSYVDGCQWSPESLVPVSAGQRVVGVALRLPAGRRLRVHMADPGRVLPVSAPAGPSGLFGGPVMVKVRAVGDLGIHLAAMTSTTPNEHDYEVTVPIGRDLNVTVSANNATIADTAGNVVSAPNTQIGPSMLIAAGTLPVDISLNVTGAR